MKFKRPQVHLLAATRVEKHDGLQAYLEDVGAPDWATDAASGGEEIVEVAGRSCYKSFTPGLNPNVTRVRTGNRPYLQNILEVDHGSVLEHGTVTFGFLDVSRVFTHEMVRHRVGTAFSQESLRFVRLTELSAYYPLAFSKASMLALYDGLDNHDHNGLTDNEIADAREEWAVRRSIWLRTLFIETFEHLEEQQRRMAEYLCLDELGGNFSIKKKITSAMRRLAPIGLGTGIVVTGNHRIWRHMLAMRSSVHAEEEIRYVFADVGHQLKGRFPNIYQDMEGQMVEGFMEWTFGHKS